MIVSRYEGKIETYSTEVGIGTDDAVPPDGVVIIKDRVYSGVDVLAVCVIPLVIRIANHRPMVLCDRLVAGTTGVGGAVTAF